MSRTATPLSLVTATDVPTREECLALVQRILKSTVFNRSTRLCGFLRYVCDCSLGDHPEQAHEQIIGHAVFGRRTDYNPADDNIVRVSARHLRSKLREYFETEGAGEIWVLEIPKGSYLPVFRRRNPTQVSHKPGTPVSHAPQTRLIRGVIITLVATVVALIFFNRWLWNEVGTPSKETVLASPNLVKAVFKASVDPIEIVPGDSGLVLMQGFLRRTFTLEEYASQSYLQPPKGLSGNLAVRKFWAFLCSRQILNDGDMETIHELRRSLRGSGLEVLVRSSRTMVTRDFMSGNFILLGSWYANPWAQLFSQRLNFQFTNEGLGGPNKIRNIHPRPGERKVYSSRGAQWKDGVSYARVALAPNLADSGQVLLIAGINMQATEAAADFLLRQASVHEIQNVLGISSTACFPNFELLLETSSAEGTPERARVIAVRVSPRS